MGSMTTGGHGDGTGELPTPVVAPDRYDERYYRQSCAGHDVWEASGGAEAADLYGGILTLADMRPGEVVLDVGCGRGELVADAIDRGASRAIGLDYADAAVALARRTLQVRGMDEHVELHAGDARALPVADASIDLVTMVDVVEHLAPDELAAALREVVRVLRPGGRLFVHTLPTRTLYEVTYRTHRRLMRLAGQHWPAEPRNADELAMHVNEQTRRGLRGSLRTAGFARVEVRHGEWMHTAFLPDGRHAGAYHRLARIPGLRGLVVADLFATAYR